MFGRGLNGSIEPQILNCQSLIHFWVRSSDNKKFKNYQDNDIKLEPTALELNLEN